MTRVRLAALAVVGGAIWPCGATANDSSAEVGIGGLVLKKTTAIVMQSEDLYVSATRVRVRYVFRNTTGQDVTETVAFPLPDLDGATSYHDGPVPPKSEDANFVGFETRIDGRRADLKIEQRVYVNGAERTADLAALGIPANFFAKGFYDAMKALDQATLQKLKDAGLAEVGLLPDSRTLEFENPLWTLRTLVHREQTFPTGRDVVVEHSYVPFAGGSVATVFDRQDIWRENADRYRTSFCIEPSFEAAAAAFADKHRPKRDEMSRVGEQRVSYILKTGANWAGPIRDFRLVVDKGSASNLVSFCSKGVKKISPTQFEMRASNFTPSEDLNVLILTAPTASR